MQVFLYDQLNRKLTYSAVNAATMQVWSPGAKTWQDAAPDALVTAAWAKDPKHLGMGSVAFASLPEPAEYGDYLIVGHDSATGLPAAGAPTPVGPRPIPATVINYVALNIGG